MSLVVEYGALEPSFSPIRTVVNKRGKLNCSDTLTWNMTVVEFGRI